MGRGASIGEVLDYLHAAETVFAWEAESLPYG